jgi:hypothetical protein
MKRILHNVAERAGRSETFALLSLTSGFSRVSERAREIYRLNGIFITPIFITRQKQGVNETSAALNLYAPVSLRLCVKKS